MELWILKNGTKKNIETEYAWNASREQLEEENKKLREVAEQANKDIQVLAEALKNTLWWVQNEEVRKEIEELANKHLKQTH